MTDISTVIYLLYIKTIVDMKCYWTVNFILTDVSDAIQWSWGTDFSIRTKQPWSIFFSFGLQRLMLTQEASLTSPFLYVDVCHIESWCCIWLPSLPNVRVMRPPIQPMYLSALVTIDENLVWYARMNFFGMSENERCSCSNRERNLSNSNWECSNHVGYHLLQVSPGT